MKDLYVTAYHFHNDFDGVGLRELKTRLLSERTGVGIIAHYGRTDGKGGFIIHDLPADAEQLAGAANTSGTDRTLASPQSARTRANCAPAYYLGRPASFWIATTSRRHGRTLPSHWDGAVSAWQGWPPSSASGLIADAGIETVCVTPITTPAPISGSQVE